MPSASCFIDGLTHRLGGDAGLPRSGRRLGQVGVSILFVLACLDTVCVT